MEIFFTDKGNINEEEFKDGIRSGMAHYPFFLYSAFQAQKQGAVA